MTTVGFTALGVEATQPPGVEEFFQLAGEIEAFQLDHQGSLSHEQFRCLSETATRLWTIGAMLSDADLAKSTTARLQEAQAELFYYRSLAEQGSRS